MSQSFRESNRLRRAKNAFEHLRAYALGRGMPDADAAARTAVERTHSVSLEGETRPARPQKQAERQAKPKPEPKRTSKDEAVASVPHRLEDRTKEQLYARAQELDVEGRSSMSKEELIDAIRDKQ